jgi:hypothetical protein
MQITTYQTITNRIRTSLLKKLSNRTRIELTKMSNQINRTRTKIESKTEHIMNFSYDTNKRGKSASYYLLVNLDCPSAPLTIQYPLFNKQVC